MAYTVKLGTFAKKENSTAQPDVSSWAEYSVTLKHGSSLIDPELTLTISEADVVNYNYAYMLGSYYFITGKVMDRNNLCTISLEKDVLASFKQAIGASSLYILRSSASSDGNIIDRFYPATANKTNIGVNFANAPTTTYAGGYYVLNVAGKNTGSSTLYSLTPSNFSALVDQLLGTVDSAGSGLSNDYQGIIQAIGNSIFQPMRYLNSVMWFPGQFTGTDKIAANEPLYIGKWQCTGANYRLITNPVTTLHNEVITLPKHPQSARGNYLNTAPYTQYVIQYDPFGTFQIDTTQLTNATKLRVTVYADALTGTGVLKIFGEDDNGNTVTSNLASVSAQVGVQLPITAAGLGSGSISSAISAIGNFGRAALGDLSAAGNFVSSGIDTIAGAITGSVSSVGSNGGIMAYSLPKGLFATFYNVTAEDNANNGRPYCQISTPATLGGFMITQKAPLSISATLPELNKIQSFLTGGFYYE